jgi:hypothetical protein
MPSAISRPDRARGDRLDIDGRLGAQLHHRALAEGPINLSQGRFKRFLFVHVAVFHHAQI